MNNFISKRTIKNYVQNLNAAPDKIFPLLCPIMEYKWIQPWKCEMIFSQSGYAEDNCVFRTDFPDDIEPENWIVSQYEKDKTIQFIRFNNSIVIRYNITLVDNGDSTTDAVIEQIITGLNEKGNKYIDSYKDELYIEEVSTLERMLNHYLNTGKMLEIIE